MKVVGIIPARYKATRLEGKPLVDICGKPMIQHVYERAKGAKCLDELMVATDDLRIKEAVEGFGGKAVMTSSEHFSGTDRVAEAAKGVEADIVVNLQGDEPLIKPEMVDEAVGPLLSDKSIVMGTLATVIKDDEELNDPDVVKVVLDKFGFALYFSRSPIPYRRVVAEIGIYKHIGLYVYRRDFLFTYTHLEPTPLEITESLEQLRALENGYKIKVVITSFDSIGVDTPEDLAKVRAMMERGES